MPFYAILPASYHIKRELSNLEELGARSPYWLPDELPPIPLCPWWNVLAPNFNWRRKWELEDLLGHPHHMHKAYFHRVIDNGMENGWDINSRFTVINKAIEAEDWEVVRAWWVNYLDKYRVLAWWVGQSLLIS